MAKYDYSDIPLVISVDGGGDRKVIEVAKNFVWKHGHKEIITHDTNLGLREHVLECGDLSEKYKSIIMLEEDCFVSPNFYFYSKRALEYYENEEKICGISLYSYKLNENVWLPFDPMKDGNNVYFMQVPSSWGQAWVDNQWKKFREYYHKGIIIGKEDRMPESVIGWPETSWKKYFYKYLVDHDLYIVHPQVSLTTNFGDIGQHFLYETRNWQVNLDMSESEYKFTSFAESQNKYDGYFEILPECIGLPNNVLMDTYGSKQLALFNNQFVYSVKDCKSPIKSFGLNLYPHFLNIIFGIDGNEIMFGRKEDFKELSDDKKIRLVKRSNEYIFSIGNQTGFKNGFANGKNQILKSKPYRLGNLLLSPLKKLLKK